MTINRPTSPRPKSVPRPAPSQIYETWRERFIRRVLVGALAFGLVALIITLTSNRGVAEGTIFVVAYLLLLGVTLLDAPYWARIGVLLISLYGLGLSELLSTGVLGTSAFFFITLVAFATLLVSARAGFVTLAVAVGTLIVVGWLVQTVRIQLLDGRAMPGSLLDWLGVCVTLLLFAVTFIAGLRQLLLEFFDTQARNAESVSALQQERSSLEGRVEARTTQLSAVNEVGRVASSILNPEELAGRVANLITDHFGYYYAALFLVDDSGEQAWLYSATGEAGRVLKENRHHLRVGGNSMVGMAVGTGKPRVALDVGAEPVRFQNPLLPYTRSEIALPLTVGDRVLGALDVQSTKAGAFGQQEIDTLQSMANQVAIALENARLFENAQKSLQEMEDVQRQYVTDAWKPLAADDRLEYRMGDEELTESGSHLAVPLALRESVIGQIDLSGDSEWTPEQRNLIETVATQAALALENARLVEQSQAAAKREHQLAEITSKIWTATTIDGILQTAAAELGQALDLSEATIELKMDNDHG